MAHSHNCSCNRNTIFGDAATFIKDCIVSFGDILIVPFLDPALGLTAMCSLRWGNLVVFDWNDLPVGREFGCKFLKKVKSPPHALPPPPHSPRRHYIDRCIKRPPFLAAWQQPPYIFLYEKPSLIRPHFLDTLVTLLTGTHCTN